MSLKVKISRELPCVVVSRLLENAFLKYSVPLDLLHFIPLGIGFSCGVFGDGDNGAYEWFVFLHGTLFTSNVAYGDPAIALRDGLIEAFGVPEIYELRGFEEVQNAPF